MGRDRLSGGSAEAGGEGPRTSRPRATRRMLLAEASRERPRAIRRTRPRARRRTRLLPRPSLGASPGCQDLLLGARGEEEGGLVGLVATGRGPRLTFLLLLFFRWDLGNPFDVLLGVPHSKVPDSSPRPSGGVRVFPLRVCRGLVSTRFVGIGVCLLRFRWVRASAPARCSPRAPGGVELLLQGLSSFPCLNE